MGIRTEDGSKDPDLTYFRTHVRGFSGPDSVDWTEHASAEHATVDEAQRFSTQELRKHPTAWAEITRGRYSPEDIDDDEFDVIHHAEWIQDESWNLIGTLENDVTTWVR